MAAKFSTKPLLNPITKRPRRVAVERGEHPAVLHNFARFGLLGFKELNLLHSLHDRSIYFTLQLLKADNAQYIRLCDFQERHKSQLWSTDLFYQLTPKGELVNDKRGIPEYEPPAGSDFDHRVMSIRWAVSLYAGVLADTRKQFIEWPEIAARLDKNTHAVEVDGRKINTDWRPFGLQKDGEYKFSRGPEIDCGTEQFSFSPKKSSTIDNKLIAHARIAERKLFSQLAIPNDFVPFVTVTEKRKETMKSHLAYFVEKKIISKKAASTIGFAVFPSFGSKEPLDTRAYTMPYERVGFPDYHFNA